MVLFIIPIRYVWHSFREILIISLFGHFSIISPDGNRRKQIEGGLEPGFLCMNSDWFEGSDYESELGFWVWNLIKKVIGVFGNSRFLRGWGTLKNCEKLIFLSFS